MHVIAIEPVTGCYACPPPYHDYIQDEWTTDERGEAKKRPWFGRRYTANVPYNRHATPEEIAEDQARMRAGDAQRLVMDEGNLYVPVLAAPVIMPKAEAEQLIARGLVRVATEDEIEAYYATEKANCQKIGKTFSDPREWFAKAFPKEASPEPPPPVRVAGVRNLQRPTAAQPQV